MKKRLSFILSLFMVLLLVACADDSFGHETYTKTKDYDKIFDLTEIRYDESAFELFPQNVDDLQVADFYCEWELGVVGSAKVEMILSIHYQQMDFDNEISRIKALGNGSIKYDDTNFKFPAYVSVLGYMNTNYYALVDETNTTIHYVLLQLINDEDIDINQDFLPNNYGELGEIEDISYNIYE